MMGLPAVRLILAYPHETPRPLKLHPAPAAAEVEAAGGEGREAGCSPAV